MIVKQNRQNENQSESAAFVAPTSSIPTPLSTERQGASFSTAAAGTLVVHAPCFSERRHKIGAVGRGALAMSNREVCVVVGFEAP